MTLTLKKLKQGDAWAWARYNNLDLGVGGIFNHEDYQFQPELLMDDSPKQCISKATQMACTQSYVIKALHGMIHGKFPQGILYLFPTIDDVTDFSTTRFKPMIKDNPATIGKFIRDTDRENLKKIRKGYIYFRGGRLGQTTGGDRKSGARVKSIPVDWVIFDEFDEMDKDIRKLAIGRMQNSDLKWETYLANPTVPDYGIDKVFRTSDQRYWELLCDSCGKYTNLKLEFLSKPPGMLKRERVNGNITVIRACKHCGKALDPRNGLWTPQYPERAKDMVGRTISNMESVKVDPATILNEWEDDDRDTTQFYNLILGEAHVEAENRLTINDVYRCCSRDAMETDSRQPRAMGIDVMSKGFWVVIGYHDKAKNFYKITWVGRVPRGPHIINSLSGLHDLAKRHNVKSAVIDLEPEMELSRDFQRNEEFEVFLCDYQERLKVEQKQDDKHGIITVRRTEILDTSHNMVTTGGRLELPRRCAEVERYAKEMSNTFKMLEENPKTHALTYRYKKLGDEHYRHATNYFYLACKSPYLLLDDTFNIMSHSGAAERDRKRNRDYDPLGRTY